MIDRSSPRHRIASRRATRRRPVLAIESLESRCLLMADEVVAIDVVAIDVVETMETDLAAYGLTEECCASTSFETTLFEGETIEYLIDPIVETGEIDFSEFPPELMPDVMFFSMGFAEGEPLPTDEVVVPVDEVFLPVDEGVIPEDVVEILAETTIDPTIFASFSVTNTDDDVALGDDQIPDPIPPFEALLNTDAPVEVVITSEDGGEPESDEDPAAPTPKTSTAQAFSAFGQSRHSLAASIASAFGSFGFDRDAQSDSGFLGGRRRGRR